MGDSLLKNSLHVFEAKRCTKAIDAHHTLNAVIRLGLGKRASTFSRQRLYLLARPHPQAPHKRYPPRSRAPWIKIRRIAGANIKLRRGLTAVDSVVLIFVRSLSRTAVNEHVLTDITQMKLVEIRRHLIETRLAELTLYIIFLCKTEQPHGSEPKLPALAQDASAANIFARLASSPGF